VVAGGRRVVGSEVCAAGRHLEGILVGGSLVGSVLGCAKTIERCCVTRIHACVWWLVIEP
jgi:hypothetical protein